MAVRVGHLLEQRVAEALHHAALVLALEQQRIHGAADVGDRDVPLDAHGAGLLVHAHLRRSDGHLPERCAASQWRGAPSRRDDAAPDQLAAGHAEAARQHLGIGQPSRRRDDRAVLERQIGRRQPERLRPHAQELLAYVLGGGLHRAPGHRRRAARAGGLVVGRDRGVGRDDDHPRERDREDLGGDLGEHGPRALSHLDGAGQHADAAVGVQADDRLGHAGADRGLEHRGEAAPAIGGAGERPADRLGRAAQALLELAVDGRVAGGERLAVAEEVVAPEVDGIAAEPVGGDVEERLERPRELRHAEAAKRAARRGVRVDGGTAEIDVRHAIGAGRRVGRLLDDARPDVGVGPDVVLRVAVHGGERAVATEADAHGDPGATAAHRLKRLRGRGRQPHGTAGRVRQRGGQRFQLRVGLAAEPAAEVRDDDADARQRDVEHLGQLDADRVGILGRRPHGEAAGLVPGGDRRVRLHRVVLDRRKAERVPDDEVGRRQRRGGVAAREVELVTDVRARPGPERREIGEVAGQRLARVDERRAGRQRILERQRRRQRLVVDVDQLERGGRRRLVDGGDRGHRLALVTRDVDGQDRTVAKRRAEVRIAPGEVGAGQHGHHAGQRAGPSGLHAREAGVSVRRAKHPGVSHARQHEIRHVPRAAGDLLDRVDAREGPADDPERTRAHRSPPPAATMASTILRYPVHRHRLPRR